MDYQKIHDFLIERGTKRKKIKGDFLHKHRILPGFEKGIYCNDNITLLTRKEHRIIHKIRYRLFKMWQDRCAYLMLDDSNLSSFVIKEIQSQNGKDARDNKLGIFGLSIEEKEKRNNIIKILNSKRWDDPIYREKMLEKFCNSQTKEQRISNGKKGGKISGSNNASNGHCAKIAHLGGKAHKGDIYLTNKKTKKIIRIKPEILYSYSLEEWDLGFGCKGTKKVKVGDKIYISQSEAAKAYNIVAASVRDRVKSKNFPEWSWSE